MSQSHPIEQFHFPTEILKYRTIKNVQHFHQLIKNENIQLKRDVSFESIITSSEGVESLNIQCKQCEAYFKYVSLKKGENFTIREYNHVHQHVLKQTQTCHQSVIERIQKFLQQDDGRQQKHELQADICTNYRISSSQFQQLYSQAAERLKRNTLLYDGKEIDELVKKLKSERFTVLGDFITSKLEREPRTITKSIVISNDQTINNYKKYGECVFLAIDDRKQLNRWFVGGILGIGRDMEMCLFGLFLMKTYDSDHLKGLLKIFFNSTETKPQTVITQDAYVFREALKELKSDGFLMSEHLIDYATHSQKLHRNNPKFRRIFGELAREPQKRKFFNRLSELYNSASFPEIDLDLEDLVSQSDSYCLSQIKTVPVGPYRTTRNKMTQKKNDFSPIRPFFKVLYERECQVGKHLYSKIKSILALLLELVEQECAEKNRIMSIFPNLNDVRQEVSKNVMDYLMAKVYTSIQLRAKKINEEQYQIFDLTGYNMVTKINQRWVCECQQSAKTMLPCVHEMLACCKAGSPMDVQVGKRWTNEDERLQEEMRKRLYKKPRNKKVTLSEFLA